MSDPLFINADVGAPEYNARELRRGLAVNLFPGGDRFGARGGVRPGHTAVSLAGTTWTVHDLTAVVYPGLTSSAGPYLVQHPQESAGLDPADGSNPRIDALDLQVRDDDEDASGERDSRVVYVTGTPASSPSAPSLTANSLRLATFLVPAGGSPAPSLTAVHPFTVAAGGVLPVRDSGELPSVGLYDGMAAWDQDEETMLVRAGSNWLNVGPAPLDQVSGTGASLELTVPAGYSGPLRIVAVARSDAAAVRDNLLVGVNNHSGTNAYRAFRLSWTGDSATPTATFEGRTANWNVGAVAAAANASSGAETGSVEIVIFDLGGGRRRVQWQGGVLPTTTNADATNVFGSGRTTEQNLISTIQLTLATGQFATGTVFTLWPG